MKNNLIIICVIAIGAFFLIGCADTCEITHSVTYYEPVYTSLKEVRSSVGFVSGEKEINTAGKIYYINNHLLINEPNEGIHFINNSDPKNPQHIGFLNIPGNFDMAAVDGYLYADSYIDLVVIDISDLTNPKEIERLENLFPNYNSYGYYASSDKGIVTDWVEVEQMREYKTDCEGGYYWGNYYGRGIVLMDNTTFNASTAVSPANPGVGGSMARFTINNQHLYMIDQQDMHIVSITDPANPMLGSKINIGRGIETIFPYDSLIFIGANDGMSIYDVSSPLSPTRLSRFNHVRSCDPVVTDGRYAYVTLRSGTECQGFTNQLDVIDIQDPVNPQLVKTYPMYNPYGLSISNKRLFICDGDAGLKIYNASNVETISDNLIKHYGNINAYDVIVIDCLVMLIGNDGLRQYTCNDFQDDIALLSHIPFNNSDK